MKVMYDINVKGKGDKYLRIAKDALEGAVEGMVPGKFMVEFLPFLRHVPPWFPLATSQRLWAKWQAAGETLKNAPFTEMKAKMVCTSFSVSMSVGEKERLSISNDPRHRPMGRLLSPLRQSC